MCLKFSLNYLRFSFARETDLPKKPKIFGKHQFLNEILSIDFSGLSVNFIIRELKFCKLAQFFCVSFSHERKFERIERKLKTQNPNLDEIRIVKPFEHFWNSFRRWHYRSCEFNFAINFLRNGFDHLIDWNWDPTITMSTNWFSSWFLNNIYRIIRIFAKKALKSLLSLYIIHRFAPYVSRALK